MGEANGPDVGRDHVRRQPGAAEFGERPLSDDDRRRSTTCPRPLNAGGTARKLTGENDD